MFNVNVMLKGFNSFGSEGCVNMLKFCFMSVLSRSKGAKSDASKVEIRLSVRDS